MRFREIITENVATQRDLEILATCIIDVWVSELIARVNIKWRDPESWDIIGYGIEANDIRKRLPRVMRGLVRDLRVRPTPGSSYFEGHTIYLRVQHDLVNAVTRYKDDPAEIRRILMKSYSDLVHELTHLYDDRRSAGKYVANPHSQETLRKAAAMNNDPSAAAREAWSDLYMTDPAEVNAWYQAAVSVIRPYLGDSFEDYYDKFTQEYRHHQTLSPEKLRRLIKRLYAEWSAERGRKRIRPTRP